MIYIVFGQPRTGTSRTMRMLELGGIPVIKSVKRDNPIQMARFRNHYGFYENFMAPVKDGYAVKVLNRKRLEKLMKEFDCKIIYTTRDALQIALSWKDVNKDRTRRPTVPVIRTKKPEQISEKDFMQSIPHIIADYQEVAKDPKAFCQKLKDFGIPIDVDRAVTGFDASLYKFRTE